MKKSALLTLAIALLSITNLLAQRASVGIHGTATEYIGDLNNHNYSLYKFKFFKPGGGISLQQYLNPSFNLVEMATYNGVQYQDKAATAGVTANFLTLNVLLKYKLNNGYLFKEDAAIAPFLIAGLGATSINSKNFSTGNTTSIVKDQHKANLALGAGVLCRFNDFVGIEVSAMFNRPFYDAWDGVVKGGNDIYMQHSIGLVFSLRSAKDEDKDGVRDRKDECPGTPPGIKVETDGCPVDSDGDGVTDDIDKCPNEKGKAKMNGCPDTDGDGVADNIDKCPSIVGVAKFSGCPDSDNDGVENEYDRCPNTKAGERVDMNGCPFDADGDKVLDYLDRCPTTELGTIVDSTGCPADTDKDGIFDNADRCPNTAGPASNQGCPEVKESIRKRLNFATRGIYFDVKKVTLKPSSYPMLDEIVGIINEYPDYNLRIGGHTDSTGTEEHNLALSQGRVNAVKEYLVSKGIAEDRLEATGFGESKPIASNKTAAGKAKNRRVELELYLK